jgi:hypothetical protein
VVLDELHVLQRGPGAVGQGHAVSGLDVRVRREREDPAAASGGEDDRLGGDGLDTAGCQFERHHSADPAVVDQQRRCEPLVVAGDPVVFQRGLEQRVQQVEAGLVGGEPGPHLLHAAERADGDVPVRFAAPRATPVLEPEQLLGCLVHERLDRVLVAQPVAAGDGVVRVLVESVTGGDDRRGPALGRDGVAAHWVDLGHDRHAETRVGLDDGDGSTQAGPTAAHDQDVVRRRRHPCVTAPSTTTGEFLCTASASSHLRNRGPC